MKKIFTLIATAIVALTTSAQNVAMLQVTHPSQTEQKASDWFAGNAQGDLLSSLDNLADYSVLWVNIDRQGLERGIDKLPLSADNIAAISSWVKAGGNLLVTGHATQLVEAIGRTTGYLPGIYGNGGGGNNPDVWGIQPVIGHSDFGEVYDHTAHAAFAGLSIAPYNYGHDIIPLIGNGHKNDRNCMWDLNAGEYALTDAPNKVKDFELKANATVLGTWQHVIDYCCAGLVEFHPTTQFQGTVIANGLAAYDWGAETFETNNMTALSANMLKYLVDLSIAAGINDIKTAAPAANAYNVAGQRVAPTAKGIVIVNGKTIMNK